MSLAAHCITARMTNWFTQTGLSTCDLHQLFTRLWWWLSLRLLKWQSPLLTRVLPRTTLTQTIRLHYEMFPPLSNHLLYHGDFTFHWEFFSFIDISMMNSTFCTKKGKYFSGLSTCDLHQLFTRLWWWLSLRLLKWQSPLLTRVLPRTTLTQTIRLHYEMFPPLSNHLLYHGDFTFHWEFFSFIDISMMNSTFCTKKGKYFSKSACFILMWKLKLCELSLHAGDLVCIQSS